MQGEKPYLKNGMDASTRAAPLKRSAAKSAGVKPIAHPPHREFDMTDKQTVIGVDIAKRVFQVHEVDWRTGEIISVQLRREKFLEHFVNRPPA
ncbi:hypothetical protein ALDI51_31970 [Alicycliphilus denitrificans]|nr:hypothetical protein ALDI51_31970 [Alicycliphilus denitrificans]